MVIKIDEMGSTRPLPLSLPLLLPRPPTLIPTLLLRLRLALFFLHFLPIFFFKKKIFKTFFYLFSLFYIFTSLPLKPFYLFTFYFLFTFYLLPFYFFFDFFRHVVHFT